MCLEEGVGLPDFMPFTLIRKKAPNGRVFPLFYNIGGK